jgi:hypothetical protein
MRNHYRNTPSIGECGKGGKSFKTFLEEAVSDRLRTNVQPAKQAEPWRAAFGGLQHLHRENKRIERIIEEEFAKIDEEEC